MEEQIVAPPTANEVKATSTLEVEGQERVVGSIPLTPLQHWFFEQELSAPEHYNRVALIEVSHELKAATVERALAQLLLHHDALRLRFERGGSGWRQTKAAPGRAVPFAELELPAPAEKERETYFEAVTNLLERRLNLTKGPLVRGALLNFGADQPKFLLLVIHRLVADDASWRILLADLALACRQLAEGQTIELPAKTASYSEWAEELAGYARSGLLDGELDYWRSQTGAAASKLPVDFDGGENVAASTQTVTIWLGTEETRGLLEAVTKTDETPVEAVVLAALAETFSRWVAAPSLLIDVEGDGRKGLSDDGLDLSRTVGCFGARHPICLPLREGEAPKERLTSLAEQLRGLPKGGVGYLALRYLSPDAETKRQARALPQAQMSFAYNGEIDETLPASSGLVRVAKSIRLSHGADVHRPYLIELESGIQDGRLRVTWTYSRQVHRHATIENLAHAFGRELRHLIASCLHPEGGGYKPSDFPGASLTQRELDAIVASTSSAGGGDFLEDVYPLSPLQQGMLFHLMLAPSAGMYLNQMRSTLSGELDGEAFKAAFQQVIDRQQVLRTSFAWGSHDRPFQVVHRRMKLPWEQYDWRGIPAVEQQERIAEMLREGQARGFDISRVPLMNVVLIRLSDDLYQLFWSYHLMILDGWSTSLILKEVIAVYGALCRNQPVGLEPPVPYRKYIDWIQRQNQSEAEAFWRRTLQGFTTPTPLIEDRIASGEQSLVDPFRERALQFDEAETDSLRSFSKTHRLTLNTLMQGTWALLLARRSGTDDVAFGSVVSGRPVDLPGIESAVGLFINTLPVRVVVEHDAQVLAWLRAIQAQQAQARRFEYSSLVDVQGWSGVPRGQNLFESILIFQNFPSDVSLSEPGTRLRVVEMGLVERNSYPLTLVIEPSTRLLIKLVYDSRRFDEATVARLMESFRRLLLNMLECAGETLDALSLETEAESTSLLDAFNQSL
jgi:non-ribosomal peptide synthase protein (TIGR01720 family)